MKATVIAVGVSMFMTHAMAQSMVYGPSYDHGKLADNYSFSSSSSVSSGDNEPGEADITVSAPDGTSCSVHFVATGNHKMTVTSDCAITSKLTTSNRRGAHQ